MTTSVLLSVRAELTDNCTRKEALLHFGFTNVGAKSIRGYRYSKCMFNEKHEIFAVQFMWRTSYHKFMSRDKEIQKIINEVTSEMWYGIDVIENFKRLSNKLKVIA